ncbi:hypothetical protein B0H13DRAFT_2327079 [Mycena leptocephala]|nr:hypothetical protein B0H13DRAFT_2327079 [Mycena leptocephala]
MSTDAADERSHGANMSRSVPEIWDQRRRRPARRFPWSTPPAPTDKRNVTAPSHRDAPHPPSHSASPPSRRTLSRSSPASPVTPRPYVALALQLAFCHHSPHLPAALVL